MKKIILGIAFLVAASLQMNAQLKVVEFGRTADLNGATIEVDGASTDTELAFYMETINEGANSVELKILRTEVDVISGTENATCWKICPPEEMAGVQPVLLSAYSETIAAGDTNATFSAHYYPNNLDGCSLMKYDWVDAQNSSTVYATLYIRFVHSNNLCTASTQEEIANLTFEVYPNPANDVINVLFEDVQSGSDEITISLIDMLGKQVRSLRYGNGNPKISLSTSDLNEGVYFLSVRKGSQLVKTQKVVVKH